MTVWKHRSSERLQAEAEQLLQSGDLKKAALIWQYLVERHPRDAHALETLGTLRGLLGAYDTAARLLRKALELDPNAKGAACNLGLALRRMGQLDEAEAALRRAVAIAPGMASAHVELARTLQDSGKMEAALPFYRMAARLAPEAPWVSELVECQRAVCNWDELAENQNHLIERIRQRSLAIAPFQALHLSDDPELHQTNAQTFFAQSFASGAARSRRRAVSSGRPPTGGKQRIRIGYLSADFHEHATALLIAELIELHDRSRFEIFGYSYGPNDKSKMRTRLARSFDTFVECAKRSTPEIASAIQRDGIDILIDLKGYTLEARLDILSHRPAPIQVHYLGYPGTMMSPWVDYLITDPIVVPPQAERYYGEALCIMPHTYQVNDRKRPIPERPPSRAEVGLPEEGFVFCGFHNPKKLSPELFRHWLGILAEVEGSSLWLLAEPAATISNLRAFAAANGVAAERIVAARRTGVEDHLARLSLADLYLDAFPYNAHTTASDALWVGVPVVTCMGRSLASRVAGSLLKAHGLDELAVSTFADYCNLAKRIALTPGMSLELRERVLAGRATSPLFDTPRFCRNFEKGLEEMWQRHERGEPPARIEITD